MESMTLPAIFRRCDSCAGLGYFPPEEAVCICPDYVVSIILGIAICVAIVIIHWVITRYWDAI